MKISILNIMVSVLMLTGLSLKGQVLTSKLPVDADTKLITYKEVVTTSGTTNELYNRAIEWINKQYKNAADATKVRNPTDGVIEIIHRIELSRKDKDLTVPAGIVDYSMKLELKDGRYRYIITSFNIKDISRQPFERLMNKKDKLYIPAWDDYLKQVDDYTRKLIQSLKLGMQAPAPQKPDEW